MLAIIQYKSFVFPSHIKKTKFKIYKTVILPLILYWCETRVLRRLFGRMKEEVTGLRKSLNKELNNFYSSPTIIRV